MIQGVVNADLEATLVVEVTGPGGRTLQVKVVIDTGYNGSLTLPLSQVTALGLAPLLSNEVRLADSSKKMYDFYSAEILWDGHPRQVRVLCLEGEPLIGTTLLHDFKLEAVFKAGGDVVLTATP
jgi:clan AA aspartic protease